MEQAFTDLLQIIASKTDTLSLQSSRLNQSLLKNSVRSFPLVTPGTACPTGGQWIGKQNNPVGVALHHGGTHSGVLFIRLYYTTPNCIGGFRSVGMSHIEGQSLRDFASLVQCMMNKKTDNLVNTMHVCSC